MPHAHIAAADHDIDVLYDVPTPGVARITSCDARGTRRATRPAHLSADQRAAIAEGLGMELAHSVGEAHEAGLVGTAEAAAILGLEQSTVSGYANRGVLPVRRRNPYKISRAVVRRLRAHRAKGGRPSTFRPGARYA